MKNYNNNFYELPFSKMFRFTSFGSEIFEVSNYLNLKWNWHFGFNNRKLFEPFAKFIPIHNFGKQLNYLI